MTAPPTSEGMHNAIDGGSLLYRLPRARGSTFANVCKMYVDYVKKFKQPTIVFDGYPVCPTTKDITHLRRSGGVVVNFDIGMILSCKKEPFLANSTNKQMLVFMLGDHLQEAGCTVLHATGDADVLITKTAVHSATQCPTTVIGEDTDLLVLFCFYADEMMIN